MTYNLLTLNYVFIGTNPLADHTSLPKYIDINHVFREGVVACWKTYVCKYIEANIDNVTGSTLG